MATPTSLTVLTLGFCFFVGRSVVQPFGRSKRLKISIRHPSRSGVLPRQPPKRLRLLSLEALFYTKEIAVLEKERRKPAVKNLGEREAGSQTEESRTKAECARGSGIMHRLHGAGGLLRRESR